MKIHITTLRSYPALASALALFLTLTCADKLSAALVAWDTSTTAGIQNANGTWGSDNFWTVYSGTGSGTTLTGWTAGDNAYFGRNSAGAGTPSGDFTVTVSGTQSAASIQQPGAGAGNFTLTGGAITLAAATPIRADQGTFTINSDITATGILRMTGGQITLGGSNTFGNMSITASGTPTLALTSSGALGSGNSLTVNSQNVSIDLRATTITSTDLVLANGVTITKILNTGGASSSFNGTINAGTTAVVQAGGTTSQLNLNGVISGGGGVNVEDGTTLALGGANLHSTITTVRTGGTLILNNDAALGTTANGTFVNNNGTLNLNGRNIGTEAITLQNINARILNQSATAAAASGAIALQSTGHSLGGSGNLTLDGVISGSQGFSKVGAGTLTLGGDNTYTGNTTVAEGTLLLASTGQLSFNIGASGVNNGVGGVGLATFDGAFVFDLTSAGTVNGNSWNIVDAALTDAYGGTFAVFSGLNAFTNQGGGIWSYTNSGTDYQFSQLTGALSVIPEPSTAVLLGAAMLAGLGLFRRKRANV
jgi:autotransporter-associated beta strand protein